MFEAIYIADVTNNLVFEYLFSLSSPTFKSLLSVIETSVSNGPGSGSGPLANGESEVPLIPINNDYFVCYEKSKNLVVYVLVSSTNLKPNPLIPFVFIRRLFEAMESYFGTPLTVTKIDANNDTLNLLINEMVDDGVPNVTDANRLRDIVPLKSLLSRILSTTNDLAERAMQSTNGMVPEALIRTGGHKLTNGISGSSKGLSSSSTSDTPWRRSNVKYTNNEMFVDIVETVNVMLKPKKSSRKTSSLIASSGSAIGGGSAYYSGGVFTGKKLQPVSGSIDGQIHFTSHLTGIPELQLILNIPHNIDLDLPAFHPSIMLSRWNARPGTLSFVPADGNAVLMDYQIDIDESKRPSDLLGLIEVEFQTELGTTGNEFEIRLFIKQQTGVTKIEDLAIKIFSKENVATKSLRCTHGDFTYNGNGRAEWNLRSVSTGIQPILRGIISCEEGEEDAGEGEEDVDGIEAAGGNNSTSKSSGVTSESLKLSYIQLSFSNKGSLASGIKVDSLKITSSKGLGDNVKPYKGVKYITKAGEYIIRA